MRVSIFTVCTPWAPLVDLIPQLAAGGYAGVEIAFGGMTYDPAKQPSFWGNNPAVVDWNRTESEIAAEVAAVHAALQRSGIAAASLATYADCRDLPRLTQAARIAVTLGCPTIRARMPKYDPTVGMTSLVSQSRAAMRELATIGAANDVAFLVELHDGHLCASASAALRVIEGLPPEHVGVIFDPANMLLEGNEALPYAIDALGPYLKHVHVKDVRLLGADAVDRRRLFKIRGENAQLGHGQIDWPGVVAALRQHDYHGWLSIKDFDRSNDGPAAMARSAAWLRSCMT